MMSNVIIFLISINMMPQNIFMDRYTIIPPLGTVTSMATSPYNLFAISDDYLIVLDKQTLRLERAFFFDERIYLVAYDHQYDEIWIAANRSLIRLNAHSFTMREYQLNYPPDRIGIGQDMLILDGAQDFAVDKRNGTFSPVQGIPGGLTWYETNTSNKTRQYPFLSPYFYYDEPDASDEPFHQFPITALHYDGMNLYVGTDRFGIFKYNTVSWLKERAIYGPLDSRIHKLRFYNDTYYFISSNGVSKYPITTQQWTYVRFAQEVADLLVFDQLIVSFRNRLSRLVGGTQISLNTFNSTVRSLSDDESYIYVATSAGLYRMPKGTNDARLFGPDRFPVHVVYPRDDYLYVGGEHALYAYDKKNATWTKALPFGVRDITGIGDDLYLLSQESQLVRYHPNAEAASGIDTSYVLLPYFNINDITADGEILYCASFAGMNYYNPRTEIYGTIHDLPRIEYLYTFTAGDDIIAVSRDNIFSLPVPDGQ
jgi:hypothetical protein